MYQLLSFDGVTLPAMSYVVDFGLTSKEHVVITTTGTYNAYTEQTTPAVYPYDLTYQCMFVEATHAALLTAIKRITGKRGDVADLVRQEQDGLPQTCQAELKAYRLTTSARDIGSTWQVCDLTFAIQTPWLGTRTHDSARWDSGFFWEQGWCWDGGRVMRFNTSSGTFALRNGGDAPVHDIVLRIKQSGAAATVTNLTLAAASSGVGKYGGGGINLTWAGTLDAGIALILDAGNWSVQKTALIGSNTDEYDNLDRVVGGGAPHNINEWLRLEPQSTTTFTLLWASQTGTPLVDVTATYKYAYE